MVRLSQLPTPSITLTAWFHAYVLCGVIGIRWGKRGSYYANSNQSLYDILVEYLTYACKDDEWTKGRVLEAMRYQTMTSMKKSVRSHFPSLFPKNKRARSLEVPVELEDKNINFDHDLLEKWKQRVKAIKQEIAMNENAVAQEEAAEDIKPVKGEVSASNDNSSVKVNFFIPEGVDPVTLTVDNYRQVTTKRFRMTKDQFAVRGLNREEAFAESISLAIAQLKRAEL